MTPSNQRRSTTSHQEFKHSLQFVDEVALWQMWCGALMILLLPVTIVLLSFPQDHTGPLVHGLLGILWVVSGFTLLRQRRRLKMLRKGLIEQMDGATKNRARAEQFYGLSILDPLTGLYNRRFGETRLEEEIGRVEESEDPLLLLAIDFDKFKEINDKLGHAAGDLALKEFSRRLQRAIRACDVPIRVGGDEFLVILPECQANKIQLVLSRMRSIAFALDGKQIPISFSYGMAQYQVGDTPETLIKRADERLYAEKAKRKADAAVNEVNTTNSVNDSKSSSGELPGSEPAATTHPARVRRSARFPKKIAIYIIGSDLGGKAFSEHTNTVELSQHGAVVVSRHKLAPEQQIIIRCLETDGETEARVVRVIEAQFGGHTYALEFLSSNIEIWNVQFPALTESEKQAIHSMFECSRCKGREMVDYSEVESNGDAAKKSVVRSCKRCGSATTWTRLSGDQVTDSQTVTA